MVCVQVGVTCGYVRMLRTLRFSFTVPARAGSIEILDVARLRRGTSQWADHAASYR
jgi:hypothetical protein